MRDHRTIGPFNTPVMAGGDCVKLSDVRAVFDGCVFLAAFGDKKEITGLFDTAFSEIAAAIEEQL